VRALATLALLCASPAFGAELVVEWAPLAATVEGYQVERRVDAPGERYAPLARVGPDATRFSDRGVSAGVRYCYRVRGVRGYAVSRPSPELCSTAAEPRAPEPEPEIAGAPPLVPPVQPIGETRDVKAIRRPPPRFPVDAQLRGISGWVKLKYTVAANGTTKDIVVTAAEPPGVFDAAAVESAQRFVYEPRLENGVAMDRPNVETEITFTWIDRGGGLVTDHRPPERR
jgi:TonB family protein